MNIRQIIKEEVRNIHNMFEAGPSTTATSKKVRS